MGSRYLSKTALFRPKTVSPRYHRFVTALFWGRKVRNGKASSCGSTGILSGGFLPSLPACLSGQGLTMGSRYLSKTALFAPKTVSPRCHRFVTALFWGRKVRNGKASSCGSTGILIESCLPSIAFLPACLSGQGWFRSRHVPSVFDRNYRSIHRIMPSGRASGNSVEVLVNFAEGAQTVSSFKFAGRPRGCCTGVRLRICRFSLFEKLLKSLQHVGVHVG